MALYPTLSESPFITISRGIEQKILKSNFDNLGKIQVKRKWLYPRRKLQLNYTRITNTELMELEQFYINRNGPYNAFTFIYPSSESETITSEYVATGDGSTTGFNLPFKGGSSISIYIDGNLQSTPSNYTITENGGTDGVDSISFTDAPESGARVICDFTGRLAIKCRFLDEIQHVRSRASVSLNSVTVNLYGILMDE
jgi:hypothetical protein